MTFPLDLMSAPIDSFQKLLTGYFRELVLATAYLEIGQQAIKQSSPSAAVALTLADGVTTEPMFLREDFLPLEQTNQKEKKIERSFPK